MKSLVSTLCEFSTSFLELIAVLKYSAEYSSVIYANFVSKIEVSSFLIDVIIGVDKFPNLNLGRAPVIMYACSPIFVFKFIWIRVDGENIENDTKTIVWIENILSVFGVKTSSSILFR